MFTNLAIERGPHIVYNITINITINGDNIPFIFIYHSINQPYIYIYISPIYSPYSPYTPPYITCNYHHGFQLPNFTEVISPIPIHGENLPTFIRKNWASFVGKSWSIYPHHGTYWVTHDFLFKTLLTSGISPFLAISSHVWFWRIPQKHHVWRIWAW